MAGSDGPRPCRRVLLKLSGEALMGQAAGGLEAAAINGLCDQIGEIAAQGVQVAIVVGGGNFFRGADPLGREFDRVRADHMGMLATVMNGLALVDTLERRGTPSTLLSALAIGHAVEPYRHALAIGDLEAGRVVVLAAGTGNPFFTTDTAASLRAVELKADLLIKATKVDGIFDSDPVLNPQAKRYDVLSYDQCLAQRLGVMDATAIALCRDHGIPLRVCSVFAKHNLRRLVAGEHVGTLVNNEGRL